MLRKPASYGLRYWDLLFGLLFIGLGVLSLTRKPPVNILIAAIPLFILGVFILMDCVVVYGLWVKDKNQPLAYVCSQCGFLTTRREANTYQFCPKCGMPMDGVLQDEEEQEIQQ